MAFMPPPAMNGVIAAASDQAMAALFEYGRHRTLWRSFMETAAWGYERCMRAQAKLALLLVLLFASAPASAAAAAVACSVPAAACAAACAAAPAAACAAACAAAAASLVHLQAVPPQNRFCQFCQMGINGSHREAPSLRV